MIYTVHSDNELFTCHATGAEARAEYRRRHDVLVLRYFGWVGRLRGGEPVAYCGEESTDVWRWSQAQLREEDADAEIGGAGL